MAVNDSNGLGIQPPELKSIAELFSGKRTLQVPPYQRSFAWSLDEVRELWEDLKSAAARSGDYFLGTMVLQRKPGDRDEIIDGQQRLACITMLFSAIRAYFLNSGDSRAQSLWDEFLAHKGYRRDSVAAPRLVLNKNNNPQFEKYVVAIQPPSLKDLGKLAKSKSLLQTNTALLAAFGFFLDEIGKEATALGRDSDEFLVPLIECLRSNVKLITIPVTSEEAANLFFESLNARGKELAVSDLVKNRLYLAVGPSRVASAQQRWDHMETELGRRPIPEFLRHYWIAKQADKANLTIREKHLYRAVVSKVKSGAAAITLLDDIDAAATDYAKISDAELWSDDPAYGPMFQRAVEDLKLFRVSQCNPLLLNSIQQFESAEEVAEVFRIVSSFAFRYFIIGNQSPGNLERESGRIAYEIRTRSITRAREVADALRAINSDSNFRADFELAQFGKSKSKIARYTLARINDQMLKKPLYTTNKDPKQINLEHILPQNWSTTGRKAWESGFSAGVDPDDFVYKIGNQTLLPRKLNSRIADKSFSDKKALLQSETQYDITKYILNAQMWGEREVSQRQQQLAKTAVQVWRL